ncbi:hypothetical protein FA95DRAFT_1607876 [Auriscalpium vulgare]|uniref:Uncharacterized protein n=1 Tax=Auriscalpium vulgare TaxID=40419 RepID=A0ACB8RN39_9AGAM|nr:hypothetical protein FA95DRAFT_1607876 [Auriscalpium vulgare]
MTQPTEPGRRAVAQEKTLGLINGISLVVGLQIGSGIFSTPGVVVANTGSVGASLIVWVLSGALSWTGASSFAELGAALPLNGGAQAYLGYTFGPMASYLYTWTSMLVLSPSSKAVTSLIFGEYFNRALWNATRSEDAPADIPSWAIQATALAAIAGVTLLCVLTQSLGRRAAVIFTSAKIFALVAVTLCGLYQILRGRASSALRKDLFTGSSHSPSSYALALYSGLWAFDGWDQVSFVGGEMRRPEKNIPRAIHLSMIIVTVLFLFANLAYFAVLEKDVVGRSNTIALDFGWTLFGPVGGALFALTVALSCFGALNGKPPSLPFATPPITD